MYYFLFYLKKGIVLTKFLHDSGPASFLLILFKCSNHLSFRNYQLNDPRKYETSLTILKVIRMGILIVAQYNFTLIVSKCSMATVYILKKVYQQLSLFSAIKYICLHKLTCLCGCSFEIGGILSQHRKVFSRPKR